VVTQVPLYERIKSLLLTQIAGGDWAVGQRVPSENELVRRVGASRMTVNRAVRELTAAGYLVRLQGVGTFVAERQAPDSALAIRELAAEIRDRGHLHAVRLITLERCIATTQLAMHFNLRRGHELFHSRLVHLENGLPLQLEDRYVNPAVAPAYLAQDFTVITPQAYLLKIAPVQSVEHIVQATRSDNGVAQLLQMDAAEPCLVLQQRARTGPTVLTAATLSHPASRFELRGSGVIAPSRGRVARSS
jgi:GntR family histidine utilization transcriptional repressor